MESLTLDNLDPNGPAEEQNLSYKDRPKPLPKARPSMGVGSALDADTWQKMKPDHVTFGTVIADNVVADIITGAVSIASLTGTLAELNTAVTDANVVSIAGVETLTNKTLTSPVITTPTGIVKGDVGLGNVDNTTDLNKPISTATQTALDLKAPIASPTFTGTVSGITKTMVGLGNVDNTSDANKPVSTAQQTALDLKANIASPTFTGTVGGITKSMVGLGNVDNTSDATKDAAVATLTNKTLTTPTIGNLTNMQHAHTGASSGGTIAIADTTGTLAVGKGGSGATTLTGILKGNGTSAFTAVTAPSGAIVGDTDSQTLTNKTLTSPAINTPTLNLTNGTTTTDGNIAFDRTNEDLSIGDGSASQIVHMGAWKTWTPSWTGLTVGNGTLTYARYDVSGKTITARVRFVLGTTSSIGAAVTLTLPITAKSDYVGGWDTLGPASLADSGVAIFQGMVRYESTTTVKIVNINNASTTIIVQGDLSATVPFTWTTNDVIQAVFTYEAA